jgi:hypothetical protein
LAFTKFFQLQRFHLCFSFKNKVMKSSKSIGVISRGFIILSGLSLLSVSLMAFNNPQSVMDLVAVKLPNNDAYSSIRGVYGGVGLTIFITLMYTLRKNTIEGLGLLSFLWGLYALSRLITIAKEGALGSFGKQWLTIELSFFCVALFLYMINKKARQPSTRQ